MVDEKNKTKFKTNEQPWKPCWTQTVTAWVEIVALLANGGSEPFEEELRKVADQLKHVVEHIQVVEKRLQVVSDGIAKSQKDENALRSKLISWVTICEGSSFPRRCFEKRGEDAKSKKSGTTAKSHYEKDPGAGNVTSKRDHRKFQ